MQRTPTSCSLALSQAPTRQAIKEAITQEARRRGHTGPIKEDVPRPNMMRNLLHPDLMNMDSSLMQLLEQVGLLVGWPAAEPTKNSACLIAHGRPPRPCAAPVSGSSSRLLRTAAPRCGGALLTPAARLPAPARPWATARCWRAWACRP